MKDRAGGAFVNWALRATFRRLASQRRHEALAQLGTSAIEPLDSAQLNQREQLNSTTEFELHRTQRLETRR